MALNKSSESVCIQEVWWKPEAERTRVRENRKSTKLLECERLPPIYSAYDPHKNKTQCFAYKGRNTALITYLRAGDENRTHDNSLEGCSFTTKLHPHSLEQVVLATFNILSLLRVFGKGFFKTFFKFFSKS